MVGLSGLYGYRDAIREHLHRHDFLAVRKMMEPYLFPLLYGGAGN
jgi:hypothetical protein